MLGASGAGCEREYVTLTTRSLTAEIETLLEARLRHKPRDAFPLERIAQVGEWTGPISTGLTVRLLLALHTVNESPAFSDACAEAIANADDWEDLLSRLLNTAQIGPHVIMTASKILRRRVPEHALSDPRDAERRAVRVCDAIDDGTVLRVTQQAWTGVGEGSCWLIGLADPVGQLTRAVATFEGVEVIVRPDRADWLERGRLACPAFLAVTA